MASKQTARRNVERLRHPPSVTVPGTGTTINLPDRTALAWYAGLAAMATVELIEWPFAFAVAGMHFVGNHTQRRDMQELCDGIEAGI